MASTVEIDQIKKAFTPDVTLTAFKDEGRSIVARVELDWEKLGLSRIYKVIFNRDTGEISSLGWLIDK